MQPGTYVRLRFPRRLLKSLLVVMYCFSKKSWLEWLAGSFLVANVVLLSATPSAAQQPTTIRSVKVLNRGSIFELEIDASRPIAPKTQVIAGPDRLVLDFLHAIPGPALRPMIVKTTQVKGIRMGLFASTPPVARVVLDLTGPQPYEVFPSGNKVIVKLVSGNGNAMHGVPGSAAAAQTAAVQAPAVPAAPPPPPQPHAEISLESGKLSIQSDRATLIDILHEVQRRTGASLFIPPGSGQEAVITQLGPAPVREVLSKLLDGSAYNVVLVGSGHDWSSVTSIILTPKGSEGEDMPANFAARAVEDPTVQSVPDPPQPIVENPPEVQQVPQETPPDAVPPPPQ
jgi:hypothetical protein